MQEERLDAIMCSIKLSRRQHDGRESAPPETCLLSLRVGRGCANEECIGCARTSATEFDDGLDDQGSRSRISCHCHGITTRPSVH